MKTSKKKIILIWDYDSPIGQINSSLPYNFNYKSFDIEKSNVKLILKKLEEYEIKSCFAITGFSAEIGSLPFNFPDFINQISQMGHEIASHSWKHEWMPFLNKNQVNKSLNKSKNALEAAIKERQRVVGFVPPHNRPATWIKRGAFSIGDKALWPFYKMGNIDNIFDILMSLKYKWVRISHFPLKYKLGFVNKPMAGKVYNYKDLLILENHYTGFDKKIRNYILNSNDNYFIISAHPLMLNMEKNKSESCNNFEDFLDIFANDSNFDFITPMELLKVNL